MKNKLNMRNDVILVLLLSFTCTSSEYNQVRYFLYTRENSNAPQELYLNNTYILLRSFYKASRISKFVTHGWMSGGGSCPSDIVIRGFLTQADYNVFFVDWGAVARNPFYGYVASQVKDVGKAVAQMIDFVVRHGSDPNQISLVGHSMGAHVMGIAGKYSTRKVAHLVGLDPARPAFRFKRARIAKGDARLVEIIHSSYLGFAIPLGNIDYYPNGGREQPNCESEIIGRCSHTRAYEFFAEALTNPDRWYAIKCETYQMFRSGRCRENAIVPFSRWSADVNRPDGIYMLQTGSKKPYGLGLKGVRGTEQATEFEMISSVFETIMGETTDWW